MSNYNMAAIEGENATRKFILERMNEKKVTQYRLSQLTGLSESTISRWLKGESNISFNSLIKICGALEIRPYFIRTEDDTTTIIRQEFN